MESLILSKKELSVVKKTIIDGITFSSGAKSSATYYHSREDQINSLKKNVAEMYSVSKEIPLILACQNGATGAFIQQVILNEFKKTVYGGKNSIVNPTIWLDEKLSDKAILSALYNLENNSGITYVLRLFDSLKKEKINNERSRKIILLYLWNHKNFGFYCVKYRKKLQSIFKHIYGVRTNSILLSIGNSFIKNNIIKNDKEYALYEKYIGKYSSVSMLNSFKYLLFLNGNKLDISYYNNEEFPYICSYYKAMYDVLNIDNIPEEILRGLISNKKHPQYNELWGTKEKRTHTMGLLRKKNVVTTVEQKIRQTKSTKELGVSVSVDLNKTNDFIVLYKTGYENGFTNEIHSAIDKLAEKNKYSDFYENIGVVLDISKSMYGHDVESKNTPIAIAEFTTKVLGKSAKNAEIKLTGDKITDISTAFIELLKAENPNNKYDAIFIVSDGYENGYEGLFSEVLNLYKKETNNEIPIFQISPIVGSETDGDIRKLSDQVIKLSVNSPKSLITQINARLLETSTVKWLENEIKTISNFVLPRTKKQLV